MKTAQDILNEKKRDIITVAPDKTVYEALKIMAANNIGSVVIAKEGSQDYIGIYTEREFVHNALKEGFDIHQVKISEVMVEDLICVNQDDTIHQLQDVLLGKCLRHLFVVKDSKVIGIISAGDVTRADLIEHEKKLMSVSWDYYEDWKWGKKK